MPDRGVRRVDVFVYLPGPYQRIPLRANVCVSWALVFNHMIMTRGSQKKCHANEFTLPKLLIIDL